ncbi:MAG: dephospho-CoA kinase [Flavobacteriales bacterium]
MIKRIGLTGGIGSGKSTVAHILEAMSYPVYYSDLRSKELSDQHEGIRSNLISLFGNQAYEDDQLNRVYLSECIFKSPELRLKVNEIIHPVVRQDFEDWSSQQTSPLLFNEAAILFETGAYKQFDAMILICAPIHQRIERVMLRDLCSKEQVEQRIQSQWSDEQKRELTNFCIENDGIHPLLIQVEEVVKHLLA